jgi:hypothetical protein
MKNRFAQLDMGKVTRTIGHILPTRRALEVSIDRTHSWIQQTTQLGSITFHSFIGLYLTDRHGPLCYTPVLSPEGIVYQTAHSLHSSRVQPSNQSSCKIFFSFDLKMSRGICRDSFR